MENIYLKELSRLSFSSRESVEGASGLNEFKDYLHVEREIERDFISTIISLESSPNRKLIFINGNVGDGKSHLISRAVQEYPEIMKTYKIHNDSTESFYPEKTYVETLLEVLEPFGDKRLVEDNEKNRICDIEIISNISPENNSQNLILAINLGVLFNLCENSYFRENFSILKNLIDESGILENRVEEIPFHREFSNCNFSLFSFAHYQLTPEYLRELFKKITDSSSENPFHMAYLEDIKNLETAKNHIEEREDSFIHRNYLFLKDENTQERVIELIMEAVTKNKLLISTREILNFIYDILSQERELSTSIFNSPDRSSLLNHISKLDPSGIRSEETDEITLQLFNRGENIEREIRKLYFTHERWEIFRDSIYLEYIQDLDSCHRGDRRKIRKLCDEVITALFLWKNGKSLKREGYIVKEHLSNRYLIMKKLIWEMGKISEKKVGKSIIHLNFSNRERGEKSLTLDYNSYSLIKKILSGYFLTEEDMENSLLLLEFWEHLIKEWTLSDEEIYYDISTGKELEINRELYGDEEDYYIKGRD